MVVTAGPEQIDSAYNENWIFKRIAMIQTALIAMVFTSTIRNKNKLVSVSPQIPKDI